MTNPNGAKGVPLLSDLGDAIKRNPVSTALIGMGLVWLFTGDRARAVLLVYLVNLLQRRVDLRVGTRLHAHVDRKSVV